jgi:hypothetical protein
MVPEFILFGVGKVCTIWTLVRIYNPLLGTDHAHVASLVIDDIVLSLCWR